ncbi:MAG: hypothetical protein AAGE88_18200 [Actinomycetota bacterium]
MGVSTTGLNAAADGVAGVAGFASLHSAAAGTTGANEISGGGYARQPVVWDAATGAIASLNGTESFSGPASQAVAEVGLFDALTGGNFIGSGAITGDAAFNAAGQYDITDITITASDQTP